jgi:hypothetical protein
MALWVIVLISGLTLIYFTVTSKNGDVIGGWALKPAQLRIGFTRMMYPFFAGLLLCRLGKIIHIKQAFLWSSLLIISILSNPRLGSPSSVWINGLYESLCIIFIFPIIVLIGAGGNITTKPVKITVQVLWRYIVPNLHYTLPANKYLHCLGS